MISGQKESGADTGGSETGEEAADLGIEFIWIVGVKGVAAVKRDQPGVWTARGHFFHVALGGDAAFTAAQQKCGAGGGEPVGPVVADQVLLGADHILRIKCEVPAGFGVAEGIAQIRDESGADFIFKFFARGEHTLPGTDEADVVFYDRANIFNDEALHAIRISSGELISIDSTQRIAKKNNLGKVEKGKESLDIAEVVFAPVSSGMAGVAVAALVGGDDTVVGYKAFSKR